MAKDDKPEFEGFFKGMDAQARDYREKRMSKGCTFSNKCRLPLIRGAAVNTLLVSTIASKLITGSTSSGTSSISGTLRA